MPTWVLFVILLVVILIILWILLSGNAVILDDDRDSTADTLVVEPQPLAEVVDDEVEELFETDDDTVTETIEPDDLKKIEGIGPKISMLLAENGILTFAQLAEQTPEQLQEILDDADIRIADPATWADQASLAAAGAWEELATLQDGLKGGRRV